MDNIALALREFERIAPKPKEMVIGLTQRRVRTWLKDHVCPVLEECVGSPRFRQFARWPFDELLPDKSASAASAVRNVEMMLVRSAQTLLALADIKAVANKIRKQHPPKKIVISETCVISSNAPPQHSNRKFEDHDEVACYRGTVQRLADHRFADLVCGDDFFGPVGGFWSEEDMAELRKATGSPVSDGMLIPCFNPELRTQGDCITRCMFHRITHWKDGLERYRRVVQPAATRPHSITR